MQRPLIRLLRLLAAVVALLQGAVPAAASVAEGVLAERGRANPTVVHMEDGRQGTCAYAHPEDCAIGSCVVVTSLPSVARGELAATPACIVPPGDAPLGHPLGARAPPTARAPPAV